MNLGFLYYYANLGGVTSVIKSRMTALRDAGWTVHAFFAQDVGGMGGLEQAGITTLRVIPDLAKRPSAVFDNANIDMLTVVDMPETIVPLRENFRGPLIYEVHTPIDRVLLKTTAAHLDLVDRILVPSRWSQDWIGEKILGSWDRTKVAIVPNMIDRSLFHPPSVVTSNAARPMIIWVGKIAAYKRWRDAVRILGAVRRLFDCDIAFVTGGDSTERNTQDFLTELVSCGLVGRCVWYYNLPTEEMAKLYRDCFAGRGLVLSTSESESFCLVAHEAMSCGLPVAAARAGALPEVYQGALAQLLFDVGELDHATQIILDLLKDRSLWLDMSAVGLQQQEGYDADALRRTYLAELKRASRMRTAA